MGIVNFRDYQTIINKIFKEEILEYKLMERQGNLELFSLAIKPQYRGQGLGSALVEDLIEFAFENNYKGIQLQVDHKDKKRLTEFYSRFGFVSIDDELEDFMRLDFERK